MVKPRQAKSDADQKADQAQVRHMPTGDPATLSLLHATLEARSKQFERILLAIQDTKSTLEIKIDTVALDVCILRSDHRKLAE